MTPDNMNNEQLLQQAQQWKQQAQQWKERAQKAEEQIRGLSWPEALSLWHTVYANPTIHFRHKTIGAGHFTKPTGRRYPRRLYHWLKFHRLHEEAFKRISDHFAKPESSAFYPREHYERNAKDFMSGCKLNNEAALVAYEERAVEDLVVNTWRRMGKSKIGFKNAGDHSLEKINARVSQINARVSQTNTGAETTAALKNRQYDKVCYVTTDQGASSDLFVVDYKAAIS